MYYFDVINLIQSATLAVCLVGCVLMWLNSYRSVSFLLGLIAVASLINILEEAEIVRHILVSPIFVMIFGPATYLAIKQLLSKGHSRRDLWHLVPVIAVFILSDSHQLTIALGSIWRIGYALLTLRLLLKYHRILESERSDSLDFSMTWLMAIISVMAIFNFIDLLRLNTQHLIPTSLNIWGQGINNIVWLMAVSVIIIKLAGLNGLPRFNGTHARKTVSKSSDSEYESLFKEIDGLLKANEWFLRPRLTLLDLSELTSLQTREISRAINLHSGNSFSEYINYHRVRRVCELIEQGDSRSFTEIALASGFSSKASFNKVFKASKFITPSEYRAKFKMA